MSQPDPLSLPAVHLEMFFNGTPLKVCGSGFVIRTKVGPMLVTAMHNLSGRELNGACKHSQGAIPNFVTISNGHGILVGDVPLYCEGNDPNQDKAAYLTHEKSTVDVALLPLPREAARYAVNLLDDSLWRPETYQRGIPNLRPADVCHVIGYPEGLFNNLGNNRVLPLWKTGHLANDPQFDFNGEDLCLIDATTRPGMSGAPVFVVAKGWDGNPACTRLIGVYSGRTSETSDLGLVWKPTAMHSILARHCERW
jgi:Trypsin-like peptidase domain